jgi:drug/metabolite transporter (DMT)-like permease
VTERPSSPAPLDATTSADGQPGRAGPVSPGTIALMVVGVVGVSMSGPIMAGATGVAALAIAFWRNGLGALAVSPFAWRARRELAGLTRRQLGLCLLAGVMLAAHFATWTISLRLTSVASATALVCLQVAWVVLLTRLSGQPVVRRVWVGLALALVGVLVISGVDFSVSAKALSGDALALAGGFFAAVYTITGGRVRETISTSAYTFIAYATSALLLLVSCLAAGLDIVGYDARTWGLIVLVTVAAQLLGHSVFNHLLATISPTIVSMVLLLEVPGAALLAAVFLGQAPPVAVYAGLALILAGLAIVVTSRTGQTPREAPLD